VPILEPPLHARRVGTGRSNLTYLITDRDRRSVVVRRPRSGSSLGASHSLQREFRVLEAVWQAGRKVPRPLAYCDDASVIGANFYVMEAVDGIVAATPAQAQQLGHAARGQTAASLAQTLAELHSTDITVPPFADLSDGRDYAGRQVRRWSRQWQQARTREHPQIDQLASRLAASIPPQAESSLVHGDFTLFNVILAPDGEVRAVLDWEMSTLGDPVADVAWCTMWWPDSEEEAAPGTEPIPLLDGFPPKQVVMDNSRSATAAAGI
jgi:aminoglycoside phosphotransferase (APT) family kinase protein